MKRNLASRIATVAVAAMSFAVCTAHAALVPAVTYQVENGKLTGAKGVTVGDVKYDVSFLGGTCASIFGECSASTKFEFNATNIKSAMQALADQVLLDNVSIGGKLYNFDTDVTLTNGCEDPAGCNIVTGYGMRNSYLVYDGVMFNSKIESQDKIATSSFDISANLTNAANYTWAKWTLASTDAALPGAGGDVPEPASIALLAIAAAGFAAARRKR